VRRGPGKISALGDRDEGIELGKLGPVHCVAVQSNLFTLSSIIPGPTNRYIWLLHFRPGDHF
jgi:hypothetical protein